MSLEERIIKLIDAIENMQSVVNVDELNLMASDSIDSLTEIVRLKNDLKDFMGGAVS